MRHLLLRQKPGKPRCPDKRNPHPSALQPAITASLLCEGSLFCVIVVYNLVVDCLISDLFVTLLCSCFWSLQDPAASHQGSRCICRVHHQQVRPTHIHPTYPPTNERPTRQTHRNGQTRSVSQTNKQTHIRTRSWLVQNRPRLYGASLRPSIRSAAETLLVRRTRNPMVIPSQTAMPMTLDVGKNLLHPRPPRRKRTPAS
jgi:hypothetical protein